MHCLALSCIARFSIAPKPFLEKWRSRSHFLGLMQADADEQARLAEQARLSAYLRDQFDSSTDTDGAVLELDGDNEDDDDPTAFFDWDAYAQRVAQWRAELYPKSNWRPPVRGTASQRRGKLSHRVWDPASTEDDGFIPETEEEAEAAAAAEEASRVAAEEASHAAMASKMLPLASLLLEVEELEGDGEEEAGCRVTLRIEPAAQAQLVPEAWSPTEMVSAFVSEACTKALELFNAQAPLAFLKTRHAEEGAELRTQATTAAELVAEVIAASVLAVTSLPASVPERHAAAASASLMGPMPAEPGHLPTWWTVSASSLAKVVRTAPVQPPRKDDKQEDVPVSEDALDVPDSEANMEDALIAELPAVCTAAGVLATGAPHDTEGFASALLVQMRQREQLEVIATARAEAEDYTVPPTSPLPPKLHASTGKPPRAPFTPPPAVLGKGIAGCVAVRPGVQTPRPGTLPPRAPFTPSAGLGTPLPDWRATDQKPQLGSSASLASRIASRRRDSFDRKMAAAREKASLRASDAALRASEVGSAIAVM